MFAWIIYTAITLPAGFMLAFVSSMFGQTLSKSSDKSFARIRNCVLLSMVGPFVFAEILTKTVGSQLEPAITKTFAKMPVDGQIKYYRVTKFTGSSATVIAVAEEPDKWGGQDRPVVEIDLTKGTD